MSTIIKVWLIICGGVAASWFGIRVFVWAMVHFDFSPLYIICLSAIYIPVFALVLYLIFAKLLFWACDCEI
jgi:hypothetical protein